MERCCWIERELILSHCDYHVCAVDSFSQLKGRGAWLKCLAFVSTSKQQNYLHKYFDYGTETHFFFYEQITCFI